MAGISLVVEDTGYGITEADLCHAFEPFARGDAWVARSSLEGAGLGLPIVRALIELIGGDIVLSSTKDIGTRVELFLPCPADSQIRTG